MKFIIYLFNSFLSCLKEFLITDNCFNSLLFYASYSSRRSAKQTKKNFLELFFFLENETFFFSLFNQIKLINYQSIYKGITFKAFLAQSFADDSELKTTRREWVFG